MTESRDVVVIGGGPAGSTFAATLKKYAPEVSVTVLEREHHPRYHIGESLIPVVNSVFRDLELEETLYDGRFTRKFGVTFVWGRDRQPWNADYLELANVHRGDGGHIIDVLGQDFSELMRAEMRRDVPITALNVRRAEFDHILVQQARHFGAEVREGVEATAVHRDESGRACGVSWRDEHGNEGRIDTGFVLDASGLRAMVTGTDRNYDPHLANFAVSGYLSGAEWKVIYRGGHEATTAFISAVDRGWIWYIPIGHDLISVGAVTNTQHFRDRLRNVDLESFFWEMVRGCPEIEPLIRNAYLRDDFIGNGRRVAAHRDWSGWASQPTGPGWAAAGDSAIFVDPILSSGLTMAVQSGHRAAYTYNTARKRPDLDADALWRSYADYIRGEAGSYLTLARYFYGNNRATESWWWEAQRVVNSAGLLNLDDREAFTMATAGFFPTPRAISFEIMAPLLKGISGTEADFFNIYHEDGLADDDTLRRSAIKLNTTFRLSLRTEPEEQKRSDGLLGVYHDLVADDFDFAHRIHAAPCRIAPAMAPVVAAIPDHPTVASLLDAAPGLLAGFADPEAVRKSTLVILRNAAKKGYLQLVQEAA